jgi:hypothetical protein
LQAAAESLKKSQLEDALEKKLAARPEEAAVQKFMH